MHAPLRAILFRMIMEKKTYTYPTTRVIIYVPQQVLAGSSFSGNSFETPSEDNDGEDFQW